MTVEIVGIMFNSENSENFSIQVQPRQDVQGPEGRSCQAKEGLIPQESPTGRLIKIIKKHQRQQLMTIYKPET